MRDCLAQVWQPQIGISKLQVRPCLFLWDLLSARLMEVGFSTYAILAALVEKDRRFLRLISACKFVHFGLLHHGGSSDASD